MKVNNKILNQNKTMNFGVKKTDSLENFVNEIKVMNPEIRQHIDNLPIIKTIQEHDSFESLVKRANANKTMFDNVHKFSLYTHRSFRILINAIGRKIIENLKASNITLTQFMLVIEDDNTGEKTVSDMVHVARQKEYNEANKEKINIRRKIYYELHKKKSNAYHKQYNAEHKEELKAYHKQYYAKHKEELKIYRKQYNIEHREELKVKKKLKKLTNQLQIYYANLKDSLSQKII